MRRKFTSYLPDCFYKDREQLGHVIDFCEFTKANSAIDFYWPNYGQAPWHIQCILRLDGEDKEVNFWPHKNKGQIIYEKAIEGMDNFINEINRRAGDGNRDDGWDPFEEEDDEDDFDVFE